MTAAPNSPNSPDAQRLQFAVEIARSGFFVTAALTIEPSERVVLFGPSGAGKSTVLEAVAGLVLPRRGAVSLGNAEPLGNAVSLGDRVLFRTQPHSISSPIWQRRIGFLRQDAELFPHLSVLENVLYSSRSKNNKDYALSLMDRLEITHLSALRPSRISGGQARRVALARVLASCPEALLLDEPFAALDARMALVVSDLIMETAQERKIAIVVVAHELASAQRIASRIAIMDFGKILQLADPTALMAQPATVRVAELLGYSTFVPTFRAGSAGALSTALHPQRTRLVAVGESVKSRLSATVVGTRPLGGGWEIELQSTLGRIYLERPFDFVPVVVGSKVEVNLDSAPLFGDDGALIPASSKIEP